MSIPPAKTNATAGVVKSPPPVRVRTRPAQRSEDNAGSIPEDKGRGSAKAGYEVGYGKPPQHSRFKPGQSGNPKGRPKSAKGLNTIVGKLITPYAFRLVPSDSTLLILDSAFVSSNGIVKFEST